MLLSWMKSLSQVRIGKQAVCRHIQLSFLSSRIAPPDRSSRGTCLPSDSLGHQGRMGNMQSKRWEKRQTRRWERSADFQSAASQVFNLPLDRESGLR